MRLAGELHLVEGEANGIVRHETGRRSHAVDPLHENAHEEQASQSSRQYAKEALELVIYGHDLHVRENKRETAAEKPDDDRRNLSAMKLGLVCCGRRRARGCARTRWQAESGGS